PDQDPFYTPDSGWQDTKPGTILKSRKVTTSYLTVLPNLLVTSYQILYRTNGPLPTTTPLASVATIFIPLIGRQRDRLVGFATAEDSAYVRCAPSYNYRLTLGAGLTNTLIQIEELMITAALSKGWTVVSPDYEGPNSTFTAGRLEGKGVLDALRATVNLEEAEFSSKVKIAQFGYSGGSVATGWAAALHPTYAPELNMVGFAYGGVPANISESLAFLDGTLVSAFAFTGLAGVAHAYPGLADYLDGYLTNEGKDAFAFARSHCVVEDVLQFAHKTLLSTTYNTVGKDLLQLPLIKQYAEENVLGRLKNETPSTPQYIYHSATDTTIPVSGTDKMVNNYCSYGIKSLVYERDIGPSDHNSLNFLGLPSVLSFLSDRFNDVPAQQGCKIANVSIPIS
ncbi:LIP-domain-containing protein, partial [Meredithblackwellia eburnea MCA 4105]